MRLPILEGKTKETILDTANQAHNDQELLWNGQGGHAWVEAQGLIDRLFRPIEALLADAVLAGRGDHVLDVGCGTGGVTLAVARRLGRRGSCVGVDISRSEEHTSELQSLMRISYAVFCLKKKKQHNINKNT